MPIGKFLRQGADWRRLTLARRECRIEPVEILVYRTLGLYRLLRRGCRCCWCGRWRRRRTTGSVDQILDALDDELRLEGLHQHAIAFRSSRARLIDRLEGAGEQQHRDVGELGRRLYKPRDFVPV